MHNAIQEMALAVVSFFIMQFGICQEKPVHHPLAVFLNHSRMIPQGFLHVGECAFDHIVCVGHTSDFLVCKVVEIKCNKRYRRQIYRLRFTIANIFFNYFKYYNILVNIYLD